jgi:hypothetical protein
MSTTNQVAIAAEGLVKKCGSATALDGADLSVPTGTVLGVLRPLYTFAWMAGIVAVFAPLAIRAYRRRT